MTTRSVARRPPAASRALRTVTISAVSAMSVDRRIQPAIRHRAGTDEPFTTGSVVIEVVVEIVVGGGGARGAFHSRLHRRKLS